MPGVNEMKECKNQICESKAEKYHNNKLMRAYHNAYMSYKAACDRYDRLVRAYKVLDKFKTEKPVNAEDGCYYKNVNVPHTEEIMRRMIEDAHREKNVIAEHARECIRHLRGLRYEM